ncbi:uncharacterized protein LOC122757113 [Drosophila mojavensis]|uniref:uncharacterized protein LOC122757113 n=1 Tax=Drosophila mojavensis TaxID=7230 RepID=UPI001CD186C7|nr:uncharacterized protein LOC122757113 [Drosophila mojavensis]
MTSQPSKYVHRAKSPSFLPKMTALQQPQQRIMPKLLSNDSIANAKENLAPILPPNNTINKIATLTPSSEQPPVINQQLNITYSDPPTTPILKDPCYIHKLKNTVITKHTNSKSLKRKISMSLQQRNPKRPIHSPTDKLFNNNNITNPIVKLQDFAKVIIKTAIHAANDCNELMDFETHTNPNDSPDTGRQKLDDSNNILVHTNTQHTQLLDHPQEDIQPNLPQSSKIPSLFLPNVTEIQPLLDTINKLPGVGSYTTKVAQDNGIRIQCENISTYNAISALLQDKQIHNHTYQLRKDRGYRIIIRHLHYSTPYDWIRDQLKELGYVTRHVSVIKHRTRNEPMNIFEVELEPRLDGGHEKILTLTELGHQNIAVEKQLRRIDPLQCHRCQSFGHSKNYCRRPFVCLKCAGPHATTTCAKTIDADAR